MTEFGFIEHVARLFADADRHGWEAIGDDCTVLPIGDEVLAITADLLVEGVHFLRDGITPRELGRKSPAVNLSDVAAMGLRPEATLLSIALPADVGEEWAYEFAAGYRELSAEYGVALVGGDTTASKNGITINVTAIGRGPASHVKRRSAARAGDAIFVGGEIGASALGLRDILEGRHDTPYAAVHRNPVPQVAEGEWLGGRAEVHAMMDLSDGLASDLRHILRASSCGAEIIVENIPAADGDTATAVCGGEDYKLLFTVGEAEADDLQRAFAERFGRTIHRIGRITESAAPDIRWMEHGREITPPWRGFTHF